MGFSALHLPLFVLPSWWRAFLSLPSGSPVYYVVDEDSLPNFGLPKSKQASSVIMFNEIVRCFCIQFIFIKIMASFSGLSNCMKEYMDIFMGECVHLISRISFMVLEMILLHLLFIIPIWTQFGSLYRRTWENNWESSVFVLQYPKLYSCCM